MGSQSAFTARLLTMNGLLLALCAILAPALGGRLPYIVGGKNVDIPGTYPWQASLQPQGQYHSCGASLVSERWLVTAAHCVGYSPSYYKVVLGMHDKDSRKEGAPKMYGVDKVIMHEDYRYASGFPNDIALLHLSEDADLSSPYIAAVAMADKDEDFAGNPNCYITGWGRLYGYGPSPDVLQEANINVYSQSYCEQYWGSSIGDYHTCVGEQYTSGACNGDSGGPMVCKVRGEWKLAGSTSWGRSGCSTSYPSVYARISYFRDWIAENTGV